MIFPAYEGKNIHERINICSFVQRSNHSRKSNLYFFSRTKIKTLDKRKRIFSLVRRWPNSKEDIQFFSLVHNSSHSNAGWVQVKPLKEHLHVFSHTKIKALGKKTHVSLLCKNQNILEKNKFSVIHRSKHSKEEILTFLSYTNQNIQMKDTNLFRTKIKVFENKTTCFSLVQNSNHLSKNKYNRKNKHLFFLSYTGYGNIWQKNYVFFLQCFGFYAYDAWRLKLKVLGKNKKWKIKTTNKNTQQN